jgi:SAM-dependent methyltransferase
MTTEELRRYFETDLKWGSDFQSRKIFDFLQAAAALAKGGAILDAGAGHQRYRPFFGESLYIGQEHPVAGVQNKGIAKYEVLCDVRKIPLKDDSVRAVLSTSSLEHMEFPDDFFRESYRTLLPGGGIFIHVPFLYLEHEIPYDFQRPTRYGLKRWLEQAGFGRIDVRPGSSGIFTALTVMRWALEQEPMVDRSMGTRIRRKVLHLLWPRMAKMFRRVYDQNPTEKTQLPIGWIATAFKPGTLPAATEAPSLAEFFRDRALPGSRLEEGSLHFPA